MFLVTPKCDQLLLLRGIFMSLQHCLMHEARITSTMLNMHLGELKYCVQVLLYVKYITFPKFSHAFIWHSYLNNSFCFSRFHYWMTLQLIKMIKMQHIWRFISWYVCPQDVTFLYRSKCNIFIMLLIYGCYYGFCAWINTWCRSLTCVQIELTFLVMLLYIWWFFCANYFL